jgi:hypothetical protein
MKFFVEAVPSTRQTSGVHLLIATTALVFAMASPASADFVKFYNGATGYSGPFNQSGTVYASTQNLATSCPGGGGSCPNDVLAASETFNASVQITATANGTNNVWDDLTPNFAGLGVGLLSQGSDADQIAGTDVLHIHFATSVTLTGIATLFDPAHTPFGNGFSPIQSTLAGRDFLMCATLGCPPTNIPANLVTFGAANFNNLNVTGQDFYFSAVGGSYEVDYYISALTYTTPTTGQQCSGTCPVPGPALGAGLPGLILAGGGLLGWWRRKDKAEAAA